MGLRISRSMAQVEFTSSMAAEVELVTGIEFFFSLIGFVADDSAWLQDAPLDVWFCPWAAHFHASD